MRTLLLYCLCVWLALFVQPALAQEGPAKPGPEHERLKKFEGQWDATVSFAGGESKATASYKLGLGGFWLQHHFKGEFAGAPFEGRGLTGYDPRKKKYISTWADSMEPNLLLMEGNFDKDGKTYTENGESPGMDGQLQKLKSIFEFKGEDEIVFTMYKVADGKDQQMMRITYKRQKK
jgi:hypothetical protein